MDSPPNQTRPSINLEMKYAPKIWTLVSVIHVSYMFSLYIHIFDLQLLVSVE